jgi:hypothetical protein
VTVCGVRGDGLGHWQACRLDFKPGQLVHTGHLVQAGALGVQQNMKLHHILVPTMPLIRMPSSAALCRLCSMHFADVHCPLLGQGKSPQFGMVHNYVFVRKSLQSDVFVQLAMWNNAESQPWVQSQSSEVA